LKNFFKNERIEKKLASGRKNNLHTQNGNPGEKAVKNKRRRLPQKISVSRGLKRQGKRASLRATRRNRIPALHSLGDLAIEIRSSLNSLQAMNRALLETNPSLEQREYAEKSRLAADSLLTLVNDLLDYSLIEEGNFTLARMNFDLRTTVEDTVQLLALRTREKGLELNCLIHHEVPSLLFGDPGRLRQILVNLTQLAFRNKEKGQILIQVTLEKESRTRATVHFALIKAGKSISPARQARLLDLPLRPGKAGKEKWGGTEIGLALSKKLVEKMGGRVGMERSRKQGSTLWFTAVFRKQKTNGALPWITTQALQGKRILVVDENPANLQALRGQLQSWECQAEAAAGGSEALVKLCQAVENQNPFVICILSKEMEEMDGIALAREIKKAPVLSETTLVLLTSQGNRGDGRLMQEIGVEGYLTRPVKGSQLRDCLALAVSRRTSSSDFAGVPLITRYSLAEEKKRRIRILLASKDVPLQKVGLQTLQKMGFGADVVAAGNAVLASLDKAPYHLILMDTELPELDGLAVAAAIRRKERETGEHMPIVGITPRAAGKDREKCLEAGMDDYISKPIQAIDLADVLERFLSEAD
jgi:two-component system, sensor histidine kinase and response regulator